MQADTIKQFKILSTRDEHGQGITVFFQVRKFLFIDGKVKGLTLNTAVLAPYDVDLDVFLFDYLEASGWLG